MKKVDFKKYRMPTEKVAEAIKAEFTLENAVKDKDHRFYGCINPKLTEESLFIRGKKGEAHYWAYVEDGSENHYNLLLLGNPIEWIRLQLTGEQIGLGYRNINRHNANVEIMFSTTKLINKNSKSPFYNWHIRYYPFTEILTPYNHGTYAEDMRKYGGFSLSGQGNGERTFWCDNKAYIGYHLPNPLSYLIPSEVLSFFGALVVDLHKASPTSADFVKNKFPILK